MLKPFKTAKLGDDIENLPCLNPKCRKMALRYVGNDPVTCPDRTKVVDCMSCFTRYRINDELKGYEWPAEPEKRKRRDDE